MASAKPASLVASLRLAMSRPVLSLILLITLIAPNAGMAEDRGTLSLVIENDMFGRGTDRHYTHGTRLAWLSPADQIPEMVDDWAARVPLFASRGAKRVSYSIGQNIFTPSDITEKTPWANERPYAGWLYGSVGLVSDSGTRLDNLELMLGVIGPWSLAGQTQDFVHDLIDSPDPQGWDHQLDTEPGLVLTYERKWRNWWDLDLVGLEVDLSPRVGASVGNVFTHLETGVTVRLGDNLPADYGPPRIRPSLPGSDFFLPTDGLGWYLFAGVGGRAVARNVFLDGNTFSDSHHVTRKIWVGDLQAGIALTYGRTRVAFTQIVRSPEFEGQDAVDSFGAISLSVRY